MTEEMVRRRESEPHVAVVFLRYEVHEKLPTGELRGLVVERGERVVKVEGEDKFICLGRLNELLEGVSRG